MNKLIFFLLINRKNKMCLKSTVSFKEEEEEEEEEEENYRIFLSSFCYLQI